MIRSMRLYYAREIQDKIDQLKQETNQTWTDMVCAGLDEDRVRRVIQEGLEATRGCFAHIHLKDVETVEGDPGRLACWVRIVRETIDRHS